jgi:hypothetical protein
MDEVFDLPHIIFGAHATPPKYNIFMAGITELDELLESMSPELQMVSMYFVRLMVTTPIIPI